MRITIRHEIRCEFDRPVPFLLRVLRMTPWAIESQHLDAWRIDLSCDCRLRRGDDAYGNVVDTLSADQPIDAMSIVAEGEVVTTDTHGILRNALERFPPEFFLRDTADTAADESLREFAAKATAGHASPLDRLHALLVATCNTMHLADAGASSQTAVEAFREEQGSPRDIAQVFIAAARHAGTPARFVSGCLAGDADATTDSSHAWAECFVPGIGWIGFDPVHGVCTHEGHVRMAIALDSIGAAFMRNAPILGVGERMETTMVAHEASAVQSRQERSFGMSQEQFQ